MRTSFFILFFVFILLLCSSIVSADPKSDGGWSDWWTVWNILEDVPVIDEPVYIWGDWCSPWCVVYVMVDDPPVVVKHSFSFRVLWGLYPLEVMENEKSVKVCW